ncbi:MAG: hypothetical protein AB7N54_19960 [Alphaproteobacteria bacterium]
MRKLSIITLLAAAVAALASGIFLVASDTRAATTNVPVAIPGVVLVPLSIEGQRTADVTAVVRFKLPFPARVLGVSATARASGGTTPTLTVDVLEAGTTILDDPIAVTAGTVAEGTVTDAVLADEAVITVNLAITGTNPTWDDITVLLTLVRT